MKDFRIITKPRSEGVELILVGELLFADAQDFMLKIPDMVAAKGKGIVFNMEHLEFIDSSGLGAILYVSEALRLQNQSLSIVNANASVIKSLHTINKVGTFELKPKKT